MLSLMKVPLKVPLYVPLLMKFIVGAVVDEGYVVGIYLEGALLMKVYLVGAVVDEPLDADLLLDALAVPNPH